MSETTRIALDLFFRILIYSGYVAGPIIILILLQYQYEKYNKWKQKEVKEIERIIVKKNEDLTAAATSVNVLTVREKELKESVEALEAKEKELKESLGIDLPDVEIDNTSEAKKDYKIKELHEMGKARKIKGFSRMKKDDLIKALGI